MGNAKGSRRRRPRIDPRLSNTKIFFSLFNSLYYTTQAFLSVGLLISLQFTAETDLTKHTPIKQ